MQDTTLNTGSLKTDGVDVNVAYRTDLSSLGLGDNGSVSASLLGTWLVLPLPDANGSFPISVTTPGHPAVKLLLVLGENEPPQPLIAKAPARSPIQEIRVVCPRPKAEPIFWRPFSGLGTENRGPILSRLATLNISWLGVYVIFYVVTLWIVKRALRVA